MTALRRLQRELKLLQEEEKYSHFNVTLVNEDIFHWNALLTIDHFGKEVQIEVDIQIPQEYPFKAPTFKSPKRTLSNPSVLENGVFCIDSAFNEFSPAKTIAILLEDIVRSYDYEFSQLATNIFNNSSEYSFSQLRNINWEKIDVNQRLDNQYGYDSILDLAIIKDNFETVKYLVEEVRADVTLVQTLSGNSPLHLAASYSLIIFQYLLEKTEIDLFLKNKSNKTAIEVAVESAKEEILEYLFSNHLVDINQRYENENTLLMVAFYAQQTLNLDYSSIIKYLISQGSDIHAINKKGNSIFHIADLRNYRLMGEIPSLRLQEGKSYINKIGKTPYMLALPHLSHIPRHIIPLLRQNNEISANCSVCDEGQKLFVLENCGHSFCSNCLTEGLSVNNSLFIPCLHRGCQVDISVGDLQILHPKFDAHSQKLTYHYLSERRNFYWCPKCENGAFFSSENIQCNVIECDCCNTSFCLCGEVVETDQKSRNLHFGKCREIKSMKTMKTIAKECPSCSVFIEHHGGCSHMTCICKYQFCFVCLGPYVGKSVPNINDPCTCSS